MKLYEITLKPMSGFGTALKGDTIFGHFCWQVVYDPSLVEGGLEKQIARYSEKPFVIFSSAYPKLETGNGTTYVLKRPDLPFSMMLGQQKEKAITIKERKKFKRKKWMLVNKDFHLDIRNGKFIDDDELLKESQNLLTKETGQLMKKSEQPEFIKMFAQSRNSINRLTQTTGSGRFAPYTMYNFFFYPETELVIFGLIDELSTDIDSVKKGLENIGNWGFGRDASIGLGRFKLGECDEIPIPVNEGANGCYILSPCVPQKDAFQDIFFNTFIRFGKHGDRSAVSRNPFKNPVIMADEGAVFVPKNKKTFDTPYVGQPVDHISIAIPETVVQGYAPYLPFKLELQNERNL